MLEFLNHIPPWLSALIALSGGAFGLIGTVLGVANFYMAVSEKRVYIRVNPFIAFRLGHDGFLNVHSYRADRLQNILDQGAIPMPAIQVINLSKFPLVIDEVGFCHDSPRKGERCAFIKPLVLPNETLPLRLEPRAALTAYATEEIMSRIHSGMKTAYATTSCDTEKTTKSKSFVKNFDFIVKHAKAKQRT